jgi:DnaB-like helicase N terminal domain
MSTAVSTAAAQDKPLPHNLEAERGVIGGILLDNSALPSALEKVGSGDFFLPQHRSAFEGIARLAENDKPINIVLLIEELTSRGELKSREDAAYLSMISDGLPDAKLVRHFAQIVKDKSRLRSMICRAEALRESALDYDADAGEIAAREIAILSELTEEDKAESTEPDIADMPEACLDGRLGEIYQKYLSDFPIAYAYLALVTAGGVRVTPNPTTSLRTNLFTALVGPIHSGKTAAIQASLRGLGIPNSQIETSLAGSAEGLLEKIGIRIDSVLYSPDELSHLLTKSQIQNASLPYVLPRLFYFDDVPSIVGGRKQISFSARLSILGGLVDDNFSDHFGAASMSGTYDRFIFGNCPSGFSYTYREPPAIGAFDGGGDFVRQPRTHSDVHEWASALRKEIPSLNGRIVETAMRVSSICAAFDGRNELRAADLDPALAFINYQSRERIILQPNPGKNVDGILEHRILSHLESRPGEYIRQRHLLRKTRGSEFGAVNWNRVIGALLYRGDIKEKPGMKKNQRFFMVIR